MESYFQRVSRLTPTRMWVNNVTPRQARLGIEAGAVGCTQNPAYLSKILKADPELTGRILDRWIAELKDDNEVLVQAQAELVGLVAKEFLPMYEQTGGKTGFVTIQGSPFAENTAEILRQAAIARAYGPNVMVKVPVIPAGIEAILRLAREGAPLCCTEVFALRQAVDMGEALLSLNPTAPIYLAHIAGIYDEFLQKHVAAEGIEICPDVLWHAGIAVAKKVYAIVKERKYPMEFLGGGARGLQHFTEMVGASAYVTINWSGTAEQLIEQDPVVVQRFHMPTPQSVLEELLHKLPDFKRGYFADAIEPEEFEAFGPVALFRSSFEKGWNEALSVIAQRRQKGR